jgi:hypothetical protein
VYIRFIHYRIKCRFCGLTVFEHMPFLAKNIK